MKKLTSPTRIPTILGLGLLFTALFLGISIYLYNLELAKRTNAAFQPKDIQVINLSDNSSTIIWQTGAETTGSLLWGQNNFDLRQDDDRDDKLSSSHQIHIVTLKQLLPETTYTYKIKSHQSIYPGKYSFKTLRKINHLSENSINKPLTGKILGGDLEPVTEALVLLQLENSSPLGVVTSTAGNFILPLANLRTQDYEQFIVIPPTTEATLTIIKGDTETKVKVVLPREKTLPPIILGQLNDFSQTATSSALMAPKNPFDINSDGKINSVDLSIIFTNFGRKNSPADVSGDGIVNQTDVDLIKKSLEDQP